MILHALIAAAQIASIAIRNCDLDHRCKKVPRWFVDSAGGEVHMRISLFVGRRDPLSAGSTTVKAKGARLQGPPSLDKRHPAARGEDAGDTPGHGNREGPQNRTLRGGFVEAACSVERCARCAQCLVYLAQLRSSRRPDALRRFRVQGRPHGDEVLARAANVLIGRAALYPGGVKAPPSSQVNADPTPAPRRHVLPKDLPGAIKQLDDQELDRLLAAALAERKRRGRKPSASTEPPDKPLVEAVVVHLTPGKMNAVRAAFKAGVKPSQIARQFGLSQSDVRKALASDASRRAPDRA
jgi:hypothetical protein